MVAGAEARRRAWSTLNKRVHAANPPGNAISWRALHGRLSRLNRLKVFFDETKDGVRPLNYADLLEPGRVSVVDLSDTGYSELNNLVDRRPAPRGAGAQDDGVRGGARRGKRPPPRVLIVIEEAHEFLSEERIEQDAGAVRAGGADRQARRKRSGCAS